jgi:hypothetical protein
MTSYEISDELRAELIATVEAANLENPEQVCDWVLDAAATGGREAGMTEIARAASSGKRRAWMVEFNGGLCWDQTGVEHATAEAAEEEARTLFAMLTENEQRFAKASIRQFEFDADGNNVTVPETGRDVELHTSTEQVR